MTTTFALPPLDLHPDPGRARAVVSPRTPKAPLRCLVCQRAFDFAAGETATVLRHIAYGYDFAHPGACLAAALDWIFVEPGYDRPTFSVGRERVRVLQAGAAASRATDLPQQPHTGAARRWWALVEHGDGSQRVETITRDPEWLDEPGAAEFPEAARRGNAPSYGRDLLPEMRTLLTV